MALPLLRPGQTHPAVVKMKRALVQALKKRNHDKLAGSINPSSRLYGRSAVSGVKRFQSGHKLQPDGVIGERTWRALGFDEPVVDEHPPALHGIPYEPGLVAVDGRWVDKPLGQQLLAARKAGRWRGVVNSGYRPAWYQKRLWDEAVRKYGSEQAASKWVARPGTSRHGQKGGNGAVDVQLGDQLDASSGQLFRPMSWEPWHVQLTGTREMPEELPQPDSHEMDISDEELEQKKGVSPEDVKASIDDLLRQLDRRNDEMDERDNDSVEDDAYEPDAASAAPGPGESTG